MKWFKYVISEISWWWCFVTTGLGKGIGVFFGFVIGPFFAFFLKGFSDGLQYHSDAKEYLYYFSRTKKIKKNKKDNNNDANYNNRRGR